MIDLVSPAVNTRRYQSPLRQQQAAATRASVIAAAQELFSKKGYPATTVSEIARAAGVSVDTVYVSVGTKPDLALAAIDTLLGEGTESSSAESRDYVKAIQEQPGARDKLTIYAAAVARLVPRIAPLHEALRKAGDTDQTCAKTWRRLVDRRAANMLTLAAELRATGELRSDLTDEQVADIMWSMNASEYWLLLQQRSWDAVDYERLLVDVWTRMLLAEPPHPY